MPELAALLAAEDAGCELLGVLDAAGWELLAGAELAAVLDEAAVLPEELLPELAGTSGIPAQEVRIIAAIIAAEAAPETIRNPVFFKRIFIFPFKKATPIRNPTISDFL